MVTIEKILISFLLLVSLSCWGQAELKEMERKKAATLDSFFQPVLPFSDSLMAIDYKVLPQKKGGGQLQDLALTLPDSSSLLKLKKGEEILIKYGLYEKIGSVHQYIRIKKKKKTYYWRYETFGHDFHKHRKQGKVSKTRYKKFSDRTWQNFDRLLQYANYSDPKLLEKHYEEDGAENDSSRLASIEFPNNKSIKIHLGLYEVFRETLLR